MVFQLDPDWPGLKDQPSADSHDVDDSHMKRIAGEMEALVDRITGSTGSVGYPEFEHGDELPPSPRLPEGAGSLADLQRVCALTETELGGSDMRWTTANGFAQSIKNAYVHLIGEQGSDTGRYQQLISRDEKGNWKLAEAVRTMGKRWGEAQEANTYYNA
ncbi:hypothetical protein FH608_004075 [Nonomuraea phyllanthi]|uniref:Uncharacterized protein n=1 Tax=Nonomuraea phyllanthi TaxID=2219224 RepID=A0A5C4WVU9_9ACTN|nr:hypothetical protein [Nonomuraea phyllanthi]KAB8197714.1 hypothetical protein FH608_004075 [Nonomuraea phyllanthi]QFY06309.1 hypothetical protein GBF35_06120 [Nonomuraea phyllanthi]